MKRARIPEERLSLGRVQLEVRLGPFRHPSPGGTSDNSPASSVLGTMIAADPLSPLGTDDALFRSGCPYRTYGICCYLPTDKSAGYSHGSLRDRRLGPQSKEYSGAYVMQRASAFCFLIDSSYGLVFLASQARMMHSMTNHLRT
jgi:hypothetical protein